VKKRRAGGASAAGAFEVSGIIVLVMFAVFYVNAFVGGRLNVYGIHPRNLFGLIGILFSPLLHYNAAHLTANAVSLFILLVVLFSHKEYNADEALIWIWVFSGLGTWIIGRPAIHIGASSIIYGLVVYLIASAWWLRTWKTAFIAMIILFFYGGIFYGMLPQAGFISWEGHLSGAIAGWWVARKQHG
jgi:membrane associated rhomboid family serine protease